MMLLEVCPSRQWWYHHFVCARLWAGQACRDAVTVATRYHSSADSLIGHGSMHSGDTVECIDDCFVMQYNQIFIGMITMQYQAKQVCLSVRLLIWGFISLSVGFY